MILLIINTNLIKIQKNFLNIYVYHLFWETSQFKGSETGNQVKTFGAKGNVFSEGVKTLL